MFFNLQVPSNYDFHCAGCKANISKKKNFWDERSVCIQFLTRIYGYQPLLYTQSRTDPVTTEIPSVNEYGKCLSRPDGV